ncbi:hypothetical protein ACJ41O_006578 [Fusarium nematophilum]
MPPRPRGLLDSEDWHEIKTKSKPEWTLNKGWKGSWRPTVAGAKRKQSINRIRAAIRARARPPPENLRPTAYLDGLRGFAALLVYLHHHNYWAHGVVIQNPIFENAFGYEGEFYFAALPGFRHFFSGGHYAVATFFVTSGYVLSLKPLALIQAGDHQKLGDALASALFRRWFRLFIPLIITVLVWITIWHAVGFYLRGLLPQASWYDELWRFYYDFKNFSFVFKEGGMPWIVWNPHLWSIPVEFRGSIIIYTALMAFSRCTQNTRLSYTIGLIFYFLYIADGAHFAMFTAGMLLCDLDLLAKKRDLPHFLARLEPAKKFIYYHLLIFSIYLGGVPAQTNDVQQIAKSRGWYYLSLLKPQAVFDYKWFYLFWAAVFLIASLPRIIWLKTFFENRFCQYLGRVSFALYMVHGPVIAVLGERLYLAAGWQNDELMQNIPQWANKLALPRAGPFGLEISYVMPHLILVPVTFGLADIAMRYIDTPSVRFASWLYKKMMVEEPLNKQAKA